jgi:hypothetical protein
MPDCSGLVPYREYGGGLESSRPEGVNQDTGCEVVMRRDCESFLCYGS